MNWPIHLPDNSREIDDAFDFFAYLDGVACRWYQGHFRYGSPQKRKLYMKRLRLELEAYEETGNKEHLFNIATYSYLESVKPQNEKFHFDNTVESATRGKM